MAEGSGRGRGLPGPPAPPCRRRLRASAPPKGKVTSSGQTCQAGASSEVKSLQLQELGWGHPTPPKRHPTPAQADLAPPGSVHLHCVGAASLQLRERRGGVLSATCTKSHLARSQAANLTGLVGWGATGTAHLERSSDFAIAGPVQGLRRTSLVRVGVYTLYVCNATRYGVHGLSIRKHSGRRRSRRFSAWAAH